MYLTLLIMTLGQRIKNEYCPTKKCISGHHRYTPLSHSVTASVVYLLYIICLSQ